MLIYDLYQKIEGQQPFSFWGIVFVGLLCVSVFLFYAVKKDVAVKYHEYKGVIFFIIVIIFNILLIYKENALPEEQNHAIVNKKDYYVESELDKKTLPFCEKMLFINKENDINILLLNECLEDYAKEFDLNKNKLLRGESVYSVNKEWNDFFVKEIEQDPIFNDFILKKEKIFLKEVEKHITVRKLNLYEQPSINNYLTINRYILNYDIKNIEVVKFFLTHKE